MPRKRISVNIGSDIRKVERLLKNAREDRSALIRLMKNPSKEFARSGINLSRYASRKFSLAKLDMEIKTMILAVLGEDFRSRFIGMVAATDYHASSSSSYEYNWDHSSHTDYKYESHTGSVRGTFSESDSHSATNTNQSFNGLITREFQDLLMGPLLSAKIMRVISRNIAQTFRYANGLQM